jgi:phosphate transport system permease protein
MSLLLLSVIIVVIALGAYFIARSRAAANDAGTIKPHSRAHYHGWWAFLLAALPAFAFLIVWSIGTSVYIERGIHSALPAEVVAGGANEALSVSLIKSLARALNRLDEPQLANLPSRFAELQPLLADKGIALASDTQDYMIPIAVQTNRNIARLGLTGGVIAILLALGGAAIGIRQVAPRARARNSVERLILSSLLGASTIAIVTTIGIVLSMLFQTISFFESVSFSNFFFGTVWDPRFAAAGSGGSEGQFGLIPLLAGTLYIALVALLVAVPVGLMSAVYMAEYASRSVRSVVKPALELLAGIPTIVYGIFALVTLGPFLRDLSAALTGGSPFIQAQSIFTAGFVMGIMLIPVVSSLSDDIITAVPRAMRDGSLGLGATRSETIRKVILPAALPGIVGAILLTASRAIGETMIVVLAAGVAANLTLNPFEAMTTITVKIVNQLTGDLEFNSPQTLVAFALGITLFFVTLVMNIVALYIVRKYREQYE